MEKRIKKLDYIIIAIIMGLIAIFLYLNNRQVGTDDVNYTLEYFQDKKIAMHTGGTSEMAGIKAFPNAKHMGFTIASDAFYAVETGNADCGVAVDSVITDYNFERNTLKILDYELSSIDSGIGFSRTDRAKKLKVEFNDFIKELRESGELQKIDDKWFKRTSPITNYDIDALKDTNGIVKVAAEATYHPYVFVYENKPAGFEIELIYRFCETYGYKMKLDLMDFSSVLPGIVTGTYDMSAAGLSITEERVKSIDFSDPIRKNITRVYVRNNAQITKKSFVEILKENIEKTFIREDRYKLFIQGIFNTIFITIMSVVIGTILSLLICLYRLTESKVANKICDIYVSILKGVPIVVILLLFFYTVFNGINMPVEYVAIAGFSLNFSAYVSEAMMVAIKSIDKGQTEAALSLGYTDLQALYKYVFVQSLVTIIPVYRGEVISLLKSTSIVGYISVQDLTRMSDIIRSRTYEPFFPLIFTAIVYFILSFIFAKLLELLLCNIDWRQKGAKNAGNKKS